MSMGGVLGWTDQSEGYEHEQEQMEDITSTGERPGNELSCLTAPIQKYIKV